MTFDEFLSWQAVGKLVVLILTAGFSFDTMFREKK